MLTAEVSAMNLLHSQHDPAFGRFVGTLALAVISVLCILLGSCISDATAAGDARVLDAKIMLPAQLRQVPQPTGDQTPITPLETAGTSPMN
jgi:hypothetical protein